MVIKTESIGQRPSITFPITANTEVIEAALLVLPDIRSQLGMEQDEIEVSVVRDDPSGPEKRKITVKDPRSIGIINFLRSEPSFGGLAVATLNQNGLQKKRLVLLDFVGQNIGRIRSAVAPGRGQ